MAKKTIQLPYTDRAFQQDAQEAMQGSLDRALIELITNSCDSYLELIADGEQPNASASVRIEIARGRTLATRKVRVKDRARGMSLKDVETYLLPQGMKRERPQNAPGRGFQGRGAKDVCIFGQATFESIHEKKYVHVVLKYDGKVTYDDRPQKCTNKHRQSLGIPRGNGTVVTINVATEHLFPMYDTFVQNLSLHYELRDYLSPESPIEISICDLNNKKTNDQTLRFPEPAGAEIVNKQIDIPGYPNQPATLRVYEASESLTGSPPQTRLSGLVVKSNHAAFECTNFRFDSDPYADWLFGSVTCPDIATIIDEDEQKKRSVRLVTRRRDGLTRTHPFRKALATAVENELGPLVQEIRTKQTQGTSIIETPKITRTFLRLSEILGSFIKDELEETPGAGQGTHATTLPNGLSVRPDTVSLHKLGYRTVSVTYKSDELDRDSDPILTCNTKIAEADVALTVPEHVDLSIREDRPPNERWGTLRIVAGPSNGSGFVELQYEEEDSRLVLVQVVDEPSPLEITELQFERKSYSVPPAGQINVRLLAPPDYADDQHQLIVTSENEHIIVRGELPRMSLDAATGNATATVTIEGRQAGATGRLIAIRNEEQSVTEIEVRYPRRSGNPTILLKNEDFGLARDRWSLTNELHIAALHPVLKQYLGVHDPKTGYPGLESPAALSVIAEIAAFSAVRFVQEQKSEKDESMKLEPTDLYKQHYGLANKILRQFHSVLTADMLR